MEILRASGIAAPADSRKPALADGLEQAFLAEMLKYAGLQEMDAAFGGGVGESQLSSMLNDAYAKAIAQRIDLRLLRPERSL